MGTPRPQMTATGRRWFVVEGESELLHAVPFGKTEVDGVWWDELLDTDGEPYYMTDSEEDWYGLTAEEFGDTPDIQPHNVVIEAINCDCEEPEAHTCDICTSRGPKALAVIAVSTDDDNDPRLFMSCAQHTVAEFADFLGFEQVRS